MTMSLPCRLNAMILAEIREVSQIGNVDVGMNVDVETHPVGYSTALVFQKFLDQGEDKQESKHHKQRI